MSLKSKITETSRTHDESALGGAAVTLAKKRRITPAPVPAIPVLCVSPFPDDHVFLENILDEESYWTEYGKFRWALHQSHTLTATVLALERQSFPVVLCEEYLLPGSWNMVLSKCHALRRPPLVIVMSRRADDYLWVEVLTRGAYDLLRKPLEPAEVARAMSLAWFHWNDQVESRTA